MRRRGGERDVWDGGHFGESLTGSDVILVFENPSLEAVYCVAIIRDANSCPLSLHRPLHCATCVSPLELPIR